jgi:hypothetical protein
MTTDKHIKIRRTSALVSFVLGTAIFVFYYLTSSSELLFVAYGFILITGLVNIGLIISILIKANKDNNNRKKFLKTCGLMLLNLPVLLFY